MLGSFRYTWKVVDITDNAATIMFGVYNVVSRESGTGGMLYNTESGFWSNQYQYLTIKVKVSL